MRGVDVSIHDSYDIALGPFRTYACVSALLPYVPQAPKTASATPVVSASSKSHRRSFAPNSGAESRLRRPSTEPTLVEPSSFDVTVRIGYD